VALAPPGTLDVAAVRLCNLRIEDLAQAAISLGADLTASKSHPGSGYGHFHPAPPDDTLRQRFNLAAGPIVLSLRGIRPVYNPLDIARAIPLVLEQVPEAQFVIRTYNYDPGLLEQFQTIVHEMGATEAVHYVGRQSADREIAALNRLAEVAISVPSSDGTPISVLEALACGVALVVSDLPSLHEWVQDQREALFVPVGDVAALSGAIVRLLQDQSLRKTLSERGPQLIHERAESKVWMHHNEGIYQRLIGGRRR
jgi:glycosyltransferase involved in cell wall biosynthesis